MLSFRPLAAPALLAGLGLAFAGPAVAAPARKPPARQVAAAAPVSLKLVPPKIQLAGQGSSQRLMVLAQFADGRTRDVTAQAKITTAHVAQVRVVGPRVHSSTNGNATLVAAFGGKRATAAVTVQDAEKEPEWSFANEIVPVFTKAGCNTGGCHGAPSGRGGFRLSLFGFEPDYDYDQVTKERGGSRVDREAAARSLILTKPTMKVPHGGGPRFKEKSEFYNRILDWLKSGAPRQPEFDSRLARIEIYPTDWTLHQAGDKQQILVMAVQDDGTTQDVTQYARFTSNDDQVAEVDDDGVLTGVKPGETSIMIRYLNGVGVVTAKMPRPPVAGDQFSGFKPVNYIDEAVLAKLREVRIPPSDPASDAEFLRRATIDTCGVTPSVEEAKTFLDNPDPAKRQKLIEQLLNRPEFVDYWTLKWSDLFRNSSNVKEGKGLQVFYRWIRDSVRQNKPWDQMTREMLTASGSGFRNGPVNWFNIGQTNNEFPLFMASATSQVFLGVRMDCARCHNHPFEAWSQLDYYQLAAFFGRTKVKNGQDENERIFYAATDGEVYHPRKARTEPGAALQPKLLGGDVVTFAADEDRRDRLAQWITSPSNPWFARSIANRLWNNFFGRGIVNPVDDYRLTNPASNPALLEAMAHRVVQYRFDLKALMRDILSSRTYQASSAHRKENVDDRLYASHALPRRLYAEVLLDAVVSATDVPERFAPYEPGRRAISIPDNRVPNGFLDLFGRAKRETACECERTEDTNVSMVLNFLNGGTINARISAPGGRVARAVEAKKPPAEIAEEFYLAALSRRPSEKERALAEKLITSAPNLREGAEDLLWSLLNMREFMFNH